MGRPVKPELLGADMAARLYVAELVAEAKRLGYPTQAAFAKQISRGVLPTPPVADPLTEQVGQYMAEAATPILRRVIVCHYSDPDPVGVKARRVSMSLAQYYRAINRFLGGLSGYLTTVPR